MLEIIVSRDDCIGSGDCCIASPGVFAMHVSGYAVIVDPNGDTEENIIHIAKKCPAMAIAVFRDDSQIV